MNRIRQSKLKPTLFAFAGVWIVLQFAYAQTSTREVVNDEPPLLIFIEKDEEGFRYKVGERTARSPKEICAEVLILQDRFGYAGEVDLVVTANVSLFAIVDLHKEFAVHGVKRGVIYLTEKQNFTEGAYDVNRWTRVLIDVAQP